MADESIHPVWDSLPTTVTRNGGPALVGYRVVLYSQGSAVLLGPQMIGPHHGRLEGAAITLIDATGFTLTGTNESGEEEVWHTEPIPERQRGGCRSCGG